MKLKAILIMVVLAAIGGTFFACGGNRTKAPAPVNIQIDVGIDTLTVVNQQSGDEDNALECRVDAAEWQTALRITGLRPNTEYKVEVRYRETDSRLASDPYTQTVTTLKYDQDAPNVSYRQENKTVLLPEDPDLEYSFDGGASFVADNQYTFGENGAHTIQVRLQETNEKYAGSVQTLYVFISDFFGGDGSRENPFLIHDKAQFLAIDSAASYGKERRHFSLLNDLDFNGEEAFLPLTCVSFAGNGKTLIAPQVIGGAYAAVFAEAESIRDLNVEGAVIVAEQLAVDYTQDIRAGLLAGRATEIFNCHVRGEIHLSSDQYLRYSVGGLAGEISASLGFFGTSDCLPAVGDSSVDVILRYHSRHVAAPGPSCTIGGLVGTFTASAPSAVARSFAHYDFELLGLRGGSIGGIAGALRNVSVIDCYAIGEITTVASTAPASNPLLIGGIVASAADGDIRNCYAVMEAEADGSNANTAVAGISTYFTAGTEERILENCFFTGSLAVSGGGMAASLQTVSETVSGAATITNCFHAAHFTDPVGTDRSTAVAEATIRTVEWQREVLCFDPDTWQLASGQYPTLHNNR